jgi:acyl carrier protein
MEQEMEPRLRSVFKRVLRSRGSLDASPLEEMEGWDSLAHIDLISAVEEEFKINVNIQDVQKLRSFEDFAALVRKRLGPETA